ncbi:Acetyl esterase/lipase [Sphingomonas palmae]|uniref:Acetyl esterase/lipase n=1 Tax=Sphingomonas palmae TaxID=1855283 RepID=A0A1H7PZY1_9SPHN|nr:alpha/beta hydrolase [Sphingomonas palmae]SEL41028.1 Acetyl esterase/lipase [Sphingomonas palmae]
MIWRWLAGALAALLLSAGAIYLFVPAPRVLSWLDRAMGGGRGVELVGDAVPFGSNRQTLDVWRPTEPAAGKRPVLVFIYGGGWANGDRRSYAFAARAFARAGFVVVVPDYRKVPQVRFPAFVQDGAAAVHWVRDHVADYGGDPARVALAGHSAGAYNAVMLALDQRWLLAEGVDPHIVKAAVGLSGPYDFYPFDKPRSREAMLGVTDPMATQPVTFARRDAPPLLLVTSSRDTQVRPYNAYQLFERVKAAGGRAKLVEHDGLTHENVVMALSVPFRRLAPVLDESVAFIDAALNPSTATK